jgi:hypothetical protein
VVRSDCLRAPRLYTANGSGGDKDNEENQTLMPADRFKILASRALGLWRVVRLFRDVGSRGIPSTTDLVQEQTTRILDALDPATRMVSEIIQPGYRDRVLGDTIEATKSAANSAIDKTAIVLGHSILDEVVTECCRLSALLMPADWIGFDDKRKVELGEVLRTPAANIGERLLAEYLEQLSRESLLDRIDILNRKYQPAPAFEYDRQPYKFDPDRRRKIDLHRQGIIHRLVLSGSDADVVSDDLRYLEATCFYFIFIVSNKHAISVDPLRDALDVLQSKAGNPLTLAYEGLLLATSLPAANEDVWSIGGSVFARDANRRSRQLPLLIPAATPDISSDRHKIVFVKYRPRASDEPAYSGHLAGREESPVGDIWVSGVDGSNPDLVLKGGARPGLVPPIADFPKELEGITSPKFDPDAKRIYFIADAWVTSGAIYVLDLESREVKFFTDGNIFVVLHGAPHRGELLVIKHRYFGPPNYGSFDHFWLVSPTAEVGADCGDDLDAALAKLYGPDGRRLAFPHLD